MGLWELWDCSRKKRRCTPIAPIPRARQGQIAYAELYVTETLWPDFTRTDLLQAVLEYQKRDRRYGGLSGSPDGRSSNGVSASSSDENLIAALRPS